MPHGAQRHRCYVSDWAGGLRGCERRAAAPKVAFGIAAAGAAGSSAECWPAVRRTSGAPHWRRRVWDAAASSAVLVDQAARERQSEQCQGATAVFFR